MSSVLAGSTALKGRRQEHIQGSVLVIHSPFSHRPTHWQADHPYSPLLFQVDDQIPEVGLAPPRASPQCQAHWGFLITRSNNMAPEIPLLDALPDLVKHELIQLKHWTIFSKVNLTQGCDLSESPNKPLIFL